MPDEKTPRHIHTDRSAKADYLACKDILIGVKNNAETTCTDRSVKADYLAYMAIICGLWYDAETIFKILDEEGLTDLVFESSVAKKLIQQGREKGIERGIGQNIERGIERGIEQGIEQGERKGTLEGLIDVLEVRFDLHDSHPLSARIAAIEDLQRLKQLYRSALQVPSLATFEQALDA